MLGAASHQRAVQGPPTGANSGFRSRTCAGSMVFRRGTHPPGLGARPDRPDRRTRDADVGPTLGPPACLLARKGKVNKPVSKQAFLHFLCFWPYKEKSRTQEKASLLFLVATIFYFPNALASSLFVACCCFMVQPLFGLQERLSGPTLPNALPRCNAAHPELILAASPAFHAECCAPGAGDPSALHRRHLD